MDFIAELRGVNFRPASAREIVAELSLNDPLALERDPDNQYDRFAIKVIDPSTDEHLGFVAKEIVEQVAPLMDGGVNFECSVGAFDGKKVILTLIETPAKIAADEALGEE